jgi:hypothetical protein
MESQFFDHERGAFIGAIQTHVGFIEEAAEETLFLDARQIVQRQLHVAPSLAGVALVGDVRPRIDIVTFPNSA